MTALPFALWQLEGARCVAWRYDTARDRFVLVCEVLCAGAPGVVAVARLAFENVRRFARLPGRHRPSQCFVHAGSLREVASLTIEHVSISATDVEGRCEADFGSSFGGVRFAFARHSAELRMLRGVRVDGEYCYFDSVTSERADFFDPFGDGNGS